MSIAEPPCVILLYRAILTLSAVPDPDLRFFVVGSAWPAYARRYLDAYDSNDETELPWLPTPHDVTTYLAVLAWAHTLTRQQWCVMALRARSYSLPLIADMLCTTIEDVEQRHAEAVASILAASCAVPLDNPPANAAFSRSHHCA